MTTDKSNVRKENSKKELDIIPVKKCYECLDRKPLEHFGVKKIDNQGNKVLWGSCMECKVKTTAKAKKAAQAKLLSDTGKKKCSKCKKDKDIGDFTPKANMGYYVQCTLCRTALGK